jgi:hypothetical protein
MFWGFFRLALVTWISSTVSRFFSFSYFGLTQQRLRWLLVFGMLFPTFSIWAQLPVDPKIRWDTLKSYPFEVIHPHSERKLAEDVLAKLHLAHHRLVHQAGWSPLERLIPVVIRRDMDLPNGYAAPLPYPHIVLYPWPPAWFETIGEYEDWVYELCLHELAHILTFEQRSGLVRSLTSIFGNLMTPNALLPRWWHEGLAVDTETRLSRGGRLRSLQNDAYVRALTKSDAWSRYDLPSLNEFTVPQWPYGHRPYLFGSLFWSYLQTHEGKKTANFSADMNRDMGGRVPYFLTEPLLRHSPFDDWDVAWTQARSFWQTQGQRQLTQLHSLSPSPNREISINGVTEVLQLELSPDQTRLAAIVRFADLTRGVLLFRRINSHGEFNWQAPEFLLGQFESLSGSQSPLPRFGDLPWASTIGRISWLQNEELVFDLVSPVSPYEWSSDLWRVRIDSRAKKRLSEGSHVREPSVSPEGEKVLAIQQETNGRQSLRLWHLTKKRVHVLRVTEDGEQFHWPTWVGEREMVWVSKKGARNILMYGVIENTAASWVLKDVVRISSPCPRVRFPRWIPQQGLIVSCDANGVWNLWQISPRIKEEHWQAVSHIDTGIFWGDWDERRSVWYASLISDSGFQLSEIPAGNQRLSNVKLPQIEPLWNAVNPTTDSTSTNKTEEDRGNHLTGLDTTEGGYRADPYLWPQYWFPFFVASDKSTALLVSTGGQDPLQKHSYQVQLMQDFVTQATNYALSYENQTTSFPWGLQSFRLVSYLTEPTQLTENFSHGVSFRPLFHQPFYRALISLDRSRRSLLSSWSEQWEITTQWTYQLVTRRIQFAVPTEGRAWSLILGGYSVDRPLLQSGWWMQGRGTLWIPQQMWWSAVHQLSGNVFYMPVNHLPSYFVQTQSWQIGNTFAPFVARGYPTGAFVGPRLAVLSYEHWLPQTWLGRGSTQYSSYLRSFSWGVVGDLVGVDGLAYSLKNNQYVRVHPSEWFPSLGVEGVFDMNLGYYFDMKFVLAWYQALPTSISPGEGFFTLGIRF